VTHEAHELPQIRFPLQSWMTAIGRLIRADAAPSGPPRLPSETCDSLGEDAPRACAATLSVNKARRRRLVGLGSADQLCDPAYQLGQREWLAEDAIRSRGATSV
jgi:hypothetical protein